MSRASYKFFLDENLSPNLTFPLTKTFYPHRFQSSSELQLLEVKDIPLFGELQARDINAIITADQRQMLNPNERDALRASGLHWIWLAQPTKESGYRAISRQLSTISMGLPHVLEAWGDVPTAYQLTQLGNPIPEITPI